MARISRAVYFVLAIGSVLAFTAGARAQVDPSLYAGLSWRNLGPFHGGRIPAVSGAVGQNGVFYMGTPQGCASPKLHLTIFSSALAVRASRCLRP